MREPQRNQEGKQGEKLLRRLLLLKTLNKETIIMCTKREKHIEFETISKTNSRALVLLEKVNEDLELLLKAFKGRITLETKLATNLQEYPNPIQEGHRLANHMWLIKDTQT